MSDSSLRYDRRSVLKATGVAMGAPAAGAGMASASHVVAIAAQEPTDVYDACAGEKKGEVPYGSQGSVLDSCRDSAGNSWQYVDWDSASPNGWGMEGRDIHLIR